MSKLKNKVAVVTGGSKGIGSAIAKALAKEGAAVIVSYASDRPGADATVEAITSRGGTAVAVQGDVSKAVDADRLIGAAIENFGRLDILVNNSGVHEVAGLETITEEHYRRVFDVNVLGMLLTTKAASKHLNEGACVINISSVVATIHLPLQAVYSASKGAINTLTGVFANELAPRKIRVNAVSPGYVLTEGTRAAGIVGTELEAGLIGQTPLGRAGYPDDIADVVTFVASDDARWVTGEVINAGGGAR